MSWDQNTVHKVLEYQGSRAVCSCGDIHDVLQESISVDTSGACVAWVYMGTMVLGNFWYANPGGVAFSAYGNTSY